MKVEYPRLELLPTHTDLKPVRFGSMNRPEIRTRMLARLLRGFVSCRSKEFFWLPRLHMCHVWPRHCEPTE